MDTLTPMRRLVAVAVAAVLAISAAGCSDAGLTTSSGTASAQADTTPLSDIVPVSDPKSYEGPSTAVLPTEDVTALVENPQQSLPATVTSKDSDGDREVTVTDTSRIIPMDISGTIAATVFALGFGDSVVGRDISTTFPQAADLPVVTGSSHTINSESVLALSPTLVITDGSIGPRDVVAQLRDAGVTVVFVSNTPGEEGTLDLTEQVAAALGAPDAGQTLAQKIQSDIDDTVAQIAAITPADSSEKLRIAFLYLRGQSGIYYLFGEGSGADSLIDDLGGIDVAAEIGWSGEKPMTAEAITAAAPDLILVMSDGLASVGGIDGLLSSKPEIALTPAGQHRRIVDMADGDILSFGPRYAEVLEALAKAIYAPDTT